VEKGIGNFSVIIKEEKFKDNLDMYRQQRIRLLQSIDYCKPIIKIVDKLNT
jgi:hypothetical protein